MSTIFRGGPQSTAPIVTVPAALPEIPYGGFSPVRLQAPGTPKFSTEPSGRSGRLKSDPDIRRPTPPLASAFGKAAATVCSASKCGAVACDHPTWAQRPSLGLACHGPTVIAYLASSASLETFRHFPAELVIGRHLTFKDLPVWPPDLPSFCCATLPNCRLQSAGSPVRAYPHSFRAGNGHRVKGGNSWHSK